MGDQTGISWTDTTWNPVRGCSRVSEGCRNCYAETMAARFSDEGQPYHGLADRTRKGSKWTGVVRLVPEHLADPIRWKKPRRIFVNSMSDLFHESLSNEEIASVFGVMAAAPQHKFQILTKRAKRMREWFEWIAAPPSRTWRASIGDGGQLHAPNVCIGIAESTIVDGHGRLVARVAGAFGHVAWPLPNVWVGVSVENQDAADERIPELLRTPAAVRFLSCEPLLGPVNLRRVRPMPMPIDALTGTWGVPHNDDASFAQNPRIDWVITGCESGPGARPCGVEWLRSLRDQCAASGVSFFLKQAVETDIGICGDADNPNGDRPCRERIRAYVLSPDTASFHCGCTVDSGGEDGACVTLGEGEGSKRKARGVIELPYLDGVQHAAFPEVPDAR